METTTLFEPFPKVPRLFRDCTITEKIDGTNAQVIVEPVLPNESLGEFEKRVGHTPLLYTTDNTSTIVGVFAGSRSRIITPGKGTDNSGFAQWVLQNGVGLACTLGQGRHFGEWWGQGVQGNPYKIEGKRFSLFNAGRWTSVYNNQLKAMQNGQDVTPEKGIGTECIESSICHVVPLLFQGVFSSPRADYYIDFLRRFGSRTVEHIAKAEGIIIYHEAAKQVFKVTCDNDGVPKALVSKEEL